MKKIGELTNEYVVKELRKQVRAGLSDMDVPAFRKQQMTQHNLLWLQRNLPINNGQHPKLDETLALIKQLIRIEEQ